MDSRKLKPPVFNKILILQTAFIGDVVLTTPLVRAVKNQYPEAEIHFITIPNSQNLIETHPNVTKLWIFDKRGKDRGSRGILRFAGWLRQQQFDLVIVPHRSLRSALLVYLAHIPIRIGFDRSSGSRLFTHPVKYQTGIHEIDRNLSLLKPLNGVPDTKILPEIYSNQADKVVIDKWLQNNGLFGENRLIGFAPGSVWFTKRWPANYWGKLAKFLQHHDYKIVLIGSEKDRYLAPEIAAKVSDKLWNAMGEFSLRQSMELITKCQLLISNDSSPTHLGVAARTPVLTIFGSTTPDFGFAPYGAHDRIAEVENLNCRPCTDHGRKKCPLEHFRCMLDLKPEHVVKIIRDMIDENFSNKSKNTR